jgi:hypothetical protein
MHPEIIKQSNWQKALQLANAVKRCGASTRHKGNCMSPAMSNGRCRMHGGKSPGAPRGFLHGKYKHGLYTIECKLERQYYSSLIKETKAMINDI